MGRTIKFGLKTSAGAVIALLFLIGGARASLFGEENALLGKILLEDVQQTLRLQDIITFATKELQVLNQKYGYEKWINKGLDQVKDYGFLEHVKTDDFIIGSFQYNMGNVGLSMNGDDYKLDNVDNWIDQVWGKSPEILNSATEYPGSLAEWKFQEENDLPGLFLGSSSMRSMVNRGNAELSYKHSLWNMAFNQKIKDTYEALLDDAQYANPGEASRMSAQSNAMQNIQLGRLDSTQSAILRLMAEKRLNNLQNREEETYTLFQALTGVSSLFNSIPIFLR